MYATSKLNMSLSKPLEKNMDEEVELEITAPQNFLRMSLCTRWTVGFIYATFDNFVEECNNTTDGRGSPSPTCASGSGFVDYYLDPADTSLTALQSGGATDDTIIRATMGMIYLSTPGIVFPK